MTTATLTRPARRPLLAGIIARARRIDLAPVARAASAARRAVLTVGGLGLLSAAAWTIAVPLGLAAAGVSLLLVEYLTAES